METTRDRLDTWISRRAVLAAAAAGLVPGAARASGPRSSGSVDVIVGEGFAERDSVRRSLVPKSDVYVGDLIGTEANSRMAVWLGRETQLKLGAAARVMIDSFIWDAGGVLELQNGAMLFDGKLDEGRQATVRSSFALIAVRGTRFFAGPSKGVFGVFVERGLVSVSGGGRSVDVAEGMGTNIASVGSKPSDPSRWGEARISEALASVE